jgi:hypothetical protein
MSMAEIRKRRGVPAKRGMRVRFLEDRYGTIRSASGGYLMIQLDGDTYTCAYHPTWQLEYLDKDGNVIHSTIYKRA